MSVQDPTEQLWGGETTKAVANFPVSGERVPVAVVRWLGPRQGRRRARQRRARPARRRRWRSGSPPRPTQIAARRARRPVPDRRLPDRLGHVVEHERQRGHRRRSPATARTPNDHVNMGQSSNDVFPSAVHLAALDEATNRLLPALERLERSLRRQGRGVRRHRQGRPHAPDGRRAGHARPGVRRLRGAGPARARARVATRCRRSRRSRSAAPRPAPGLNTHPEFAAKVRERLSADIGLDVRAPEDPFEAQGNRDALVELSGALKVIAVSLTKIANDLALMGSGPRAGHRRAVPARAAEGLLDHAGQGQPGDPRGRAAGLRAGDRQRHRDHRRRPPGPVRAQRADPADRAQPAAVDRAARRRRASCSPRSASTASRRTSPAARPRPRARSRSRPRSTRTSATTRRPRSSRTRRRAAARCARSRASTASTRRRSTRRWTCAGSPRARPRADDRGREASR